MTDGRDDAPYNPYRPGCDEALVGEAPVSTDAPVAVESNAWRRCFGAQRIP